MGKKKKFIDKKKAATFQLISRDSSDPNYSEDPSSDRVFVRVDGNSEKPFFDEHDNGIFDDAPEDYSGEEIDVREKQTPAGGGRLPGGSSLPDDVRREIVELGFPDDGYNYLSHLREIRVAGGGSSFYQNPKAILDQLPRDIKVEWWWCEPEWVDPGGGLAEVVCDYVRCSCRWCEAEISSGHGSRRRELPGRFDGDGGHGSRRWGDGDDGFLIKIGS